MRLDIGIAVSKTQSPLWWPAITGLVLELDHLEDVQIGKVITMASALPGTSATRLPTCSSSRS